MTDLDRLREIAHKASYGTPPPSVEDVRWLLDEHQKYLLILAAILTDDGVPARRMVAERAEACRYTVPPKRCEKCGGNGNVARNIYEQKYRTDNVICPDCNGTGYQEANP